MLPQIAAVFSKLPDHAKFEQQNLKIRVGQPLAAVNRGLDPIGRLPAA